MAQRCKARAGWASTPGLAVALCALLTSTGPAAAQPGASPAAPTPAAIAAANRVTWGVDQAALAAPPGQLFLAGNPPLPPVAQAQIDAMRITREPMVQIAQEMQAQSKAINAMPDPAARQTARQQWQQALGDLQREAATRSLLRDLYSPAQLQEQMTWFWCNHFSVFAGKREIRMLLGGYEDGLRARALGHFRDLLEASLRAPAMLQYLDNDQNAAGHINENYARELLELHSMGVGSGYSQTDVQELARILTGVGIRFEGDDPRLPPQLQRYYRRDGLMVFNPQRHDFGDKHFLGHIISGKGPNGGWGEVEQALNLIAASPATARHVSAQIAQYFMGDGVPPALVDRMAAAWQHSGGDIPTVLRLLFAAPEYRASLGKGFKDPVHYVVSAVRLAYDGRVILNTDPMLGWLGRMGEGLYGRETPDGYPLAAAAWTGPGQMEARFEIARAIGNGSAGLFKPRGANTTDQPAFPQLQNALYYNALATTLSPRARATLAQATSPQEWNMLFLASPDFMRR